MLTFVIVTALACVFVLLGLRHRRTLIGLVVLLLPTYVVRFNLTPFPVLHKLPTTLLEIALLAYFASFSVHALTHRPDKISLQSFFQTPLQWLPVLTVLAACLGVWVAPQKIAALGLLRAYFIEPVLFFYLLFWEIRHQPALVKIIYGALLGMMGWLSLDGIGQYLVTHQFHLNFADTTENRITAVFNTPNAIGLLLAPLITLFIPMGIWLWRNHHRRLVAAIGVISLMAVLCLWWSISRASWIGLIAGIVVIGVSLAGKKAIPLLVLLTLVVGTTAYLTQTRVRDFFSPSANAHDLFGDNSANVRVLVYGATFRMLQDRPLLGAGLGAFQARIIQYNIGPLTDIPIFPHNIFLNFWTETGLLGLLVFCLLLGRLLWLCYRQLPSRQAPYTLSNAIFLGSLAFLTTLIVHGLFDVPYFKNDLSLLFWMIAALIAGTTLHNGSTKSSQPHADTLQ